MQVPAQSLVRNMVRLGTGEGLARLCGIATLLLLAHRYGVVVVGVYALGQTMGQHSVPFIDFGLKHVGARLVAQYPQAAHEIVRRVQRRRWSMALLLLPFLLVYASLTRLALDLKIYLLLFAGLCTLHVLSLDWLAWGKEHMRLVGLARSSVPLTVLISVVVGRNRGNILWWVLAGSFLGALLQGAVFWGWWERYKPAAEEPSALPVIQDSLAWRRTSILGLATLCNLAFNSIDMLMLGVMARPEQVGLYSASYRVINQVLYTYYLLTQVLYPQLARQEVGQRKRMLRPRILLTLLAAGIAIAAALTLVRRPLLMLLFGQQFLPATMLLLLLAWAIPLDFLTSYLSNAYIAWGMEKKILVSMGVAAGSNIVLNLIWIPAHGAAAAAVNTLISYGILLASLALAGWTARQLTSPAEPLSELIA
ncbi:MAG: oligosaccharide flippase family protein [Candidatus Korobacteraceae bacterium]